MNDRSCILSRETAPREGLVRLALGPDGQIHPDVRAKAPGRGAWIGVDKPVLEAAIAKGRLRGALSRAFRTSDITVPPDLADRIAHALQRAALDRLGLEAKAGTLLTGGERIEEAARLGRLHRLYHAADAGSDGVRRLAQAWRVGRDAEGSGLMGVVLPIPRTILSLALGRENVVHIGLTDARAAKRVSETLDRWLHFIGPDPVPQPCETGSQGASTATAAERGTAGTNAPADAGQNAPAPAGTTNEGLRVPE
ncbi:transcription terminating nucleic-acid-binding protein [Sphingomonas spermidinifaciens]|uniref:Transcription terminating nucleic-acid-binding protein n=1 Tax=Sphingomonas spermidinifaciens TaxID=1141889 RepID=A0A2A4B4W7_9SPHN|nr:DUF448 domain-containing protein [Sphingomonas spermidinifaciens]PCD04243.1 transcription terminating nucleic-acid-binding protein [Sphingomonas spermidinifaciens]